MVRFEWNLFHMEGHREKWKPWYNFSPMVNHLAPMGENVSPKQWTSTIMIRFEWYLFHMKDCFSPFSHIWLLFLPSFVQFFLPIFNKKIPTKPKVSGTWRANMPPLGFVLSIFWDGYWSLRKLCRKKKIFNGYTCQRVTMESSLDLKIGIWNTILSTTNQIGSIISLPKGLGQGKTEKSARRSQFKKNG